MKSRHAEMERFLEPGLRCRTYLNLGIRAGGIQDHGLEPLRMGYSDAAPATVELPRTIRIRKHIGTPATHDPRGEIEHKNSGTNYCD
jgi:hypothetical protein